jgi:hypothetical protein
VDKELRAILLAVVAAVALTCGSFAYQRRGPELAVVGNLCGPQMNELCYAPILKGGYPLAYIYDNPNTSVEGDLGVEDKLRPGAFVLDVLAYFVVLLLAGKALGYARTRRRGRAG